jgi:hypothetical protein
VGCSTDQTKDGKKIAKAATTTTYPIQPLIIDSSDDEGWGADIRLSLTETTSADSLVTYKAISSYKGENMGLEFRLPNDKPGVSNSPTQILTIRSSGETSDNLLMFLATLYKLKADSSKRFIKSAKIAFVDLNEFARTKFGKDAIPNTEAKEMKLFFETDDPNDYGELYVNINEKEHWLELREKDEGYRQQVIRFLTAK